MKPKKKYLCYLSVCMAGACWGFIGVFNRMLGSLGISVWNRVFLRNFPSLVLLTLVFACGKRSVFSVRRRHIPFFAASGIVSVLGMGVTYFNCQTRCSLATAATLLYLAPSLVVLSGAVLWREKLTGNRIAALLLSLLGCALVSGTVSGGFYGSREGILFGLGSAFCYASYTVLAHYTMRCYDSLGVIYWTFFFAGIGSLAFLNAPAVLPAFTTAQGLLGTAGLVLVATVLPYLLYTKGLEGIESGKAAILTNVEPVVAALTGVIFYHETPDVWTVCGIACVLGGVVLLAKEDQRGKE